MCSGVSNRGGESVPGGEKKKNCPFKTPQKNLKKVLNCGGIVITPEMRKRENGGSVPVVFDWNEVD